MTVRCPASKGHLDTFLDYRPQGTEDLMGRDLEIRHTGFGILSLLNFYQVLPRESCNLGQAIESP